MKYPIVLHKDPGSSYGVTVPDLPGCFSAGDTVEEALVLAREAILGHLQALLETGQNVPDPQPIEVHQRDPDYRDAALWAVVEVDTSHLPGRAVRINISINDRVLAVIDDFAQRQGETRSGLLQRAASEYISQRQGDRRVKPGTGRAARLRPTSRRKSTRR